MEDIFVTISRTTMTFILILTLVRIAGRKTISQMTFFNFVVAMTIGSVTANLLVGPNAGTLKTGTILVTLIFLLVIADLLHIKSFSLRKLMNSEPLVVIENGQIIDKNMRKTRIALSDLTSMLRNKNIFNITDVEYAILENDGSLSVLPKSEKQPLTPSDLGLITSYKGITYDVIIDGNIMEENLKYTKIDMETLLNMIKSQGIKDITEIFYAGIDASGTLYVSKKIKKKEREGEHGIE